MNYVEVALINDIRSIMGVSGDKIYFLSPDRHFGYILPKRGFKKVILCEGAGDARVFDKYVNVTIMGERRTRSIIITDEEPEEETRSLKVFDVQTDELLVTLPGVVCASTIYRNGELVYGQELKLSETINRFNFVTRQSEIIMHGRLGNTSACIGELLITDFAAYQIRAYNLANREVAWDLNVRKPGTYETNIEAIADAEHWVQIDGYLKNLVFAEDRIYFMSPMKLFCVNGLTGDILWHTGFADMEDLVYGDGQLLLYNGVRGTFSALNAETVRVSAADPELRRGAVALTKDLIFLTLQEGKIRVISLKDFSKLAVIDLQITDYSCRWPCVPYGPYVMQVSSKGLHVWHPDGV